jgi:hypothetical protein
VVCLSAKVNFCVVYKVAMPKELRNSRISKFTSLARVLQHDLWVNQDLTTSSSPLFNNLNLTGDATVEGNLYVLGNTTVLDTNVVEIEDNIILINRGEVGQGVTLNLAGFEVDRGPAQELYRAVFQETDGTFRIGFGDNLERVTTIEDNPLLGGVLTWDPTRNYIISTKELPIDFKFISTTNSTSSTTGSLVTLGGLGVVKDMTINGKINVTGSDTALVTSLFTDDSSNFNVNSTAGILLNGTSFVQVPYAVPLQIGSSVNSLLAGSNNQVTITSASDMRLAAPRVRLNAESPLVFSQTADFPRMFRNTNAALVLENVGQDIFLQTNTRVFMPTNTRLEFGGIDVRVFSNTSREMVFEASNNILLKPGFDVQIPTNKDLRMGDTGSQRLVSTSTNVFRMTSANDIELTPAAGRNVRIPSLIGVTFGPSTTQQIREDGNNNLTLTAQNEVKFLQNSYMTSTTNATSGQTGSLHTDGGLGVKKDIFVEKGVIVRSDNAEALQIGNIVNQRVLVADTTANGNVKVIAGYGQVASPSLSVSTMNNVSAYSLAEFTFANDQTQGYNIGRGSQSTYSGRALTFSVPRYAQYGNSGERPKIVFTSGPGDVELFSIEGETKHAWFRGLCEITATTDASETSLGSLYVHGGMSVDKNAFFYKDMCLKSNSESAFTIKNASGNLLTVDNSIAEVVHVKGKQNVFQPVSTLQVRNADEKNLFEISVAQEKCTTTMPFAFLNSQDASTPNVASLVVQGGVSIKKKLIVSGLIDSLADINMNSGFIYNTPSPERDDHVANKGYVDLVFMSQLQIKDACTVATTDNIDIQTALQPGSVIDDHTLSQGERVLVWKQVDRVENGIYIVPAASGTVQRAPDMDIGSSALRSYIFVVEGNENGYIAFLNNNIATTPDTSIVGTDALNFVYFYGNTKVIAGDGLFKTGSVLDVLVDDFSIEIVSDRLELSSQGIGTGLIGGSGETLETDTDQSHVEMLGTINAGTWEASTVQVPFGGTGNEEFTQGSIVFGNADERLLTSEELHWDNTSTFLGVGTNVPTTKLDVVSSGETIVRIASSENEQAGLRMEKEDGGDIVHATVALVPNNDDLANDSLRDALLVKNENEAIQFATQEDVRMTIAKEGFVGINTIEPVSALHVDGVVTVSNDTNTDTPTNGSFTTAGGIGIEKNVVVGGELLVAADNSDTATLQLGKHDTSKDAQVTFVTDDTVGASIHCDTTGSLHVSSVGSMRLDSEEHILFENDLDVVNMSTASVLVNGGVVVKKQLHIGDALDVQGQVSIIGSLQFETREDANYIVSLDNDRDNAFFPLSFGKEGSILALQSTGVIVCSSGSLRFGGDLGTEEGFAMHYSGQDLRIDSLGGGAVVFGAESPTNVELNGDSGNVSWNYLDSVVSVTNAQVTFKGEADGQLTLLPIDEQGVGSVQAKDKDLTLKYGEGGTHELSTIFSNKEGTAQVSLAMDVTSGTLTASEAITTTLNGLTNINNTVTFTGNAQHHTIETHSSRKWVYLNSITQYTELALSTKASRLMFAARVESSTGDLHAKHLYFNDKTSAAAVVVYKDAVGTYHAFVSVAPNTTCVVSTTIQQGDSFGYEDRGSASAPSNTTGFEKVYDTSTNLENMELRVGNVTIEGDTVLIADAFPVIGYNRDSEQDKGILLQRFQKENNNGEGELLLRDTPAYEDILPPQQVGMQDTHVKINPVPGKDLTDYWIHIQDGDGFNQVRQIVAYQSGTGICKLKSPWLVAPQAGDAYALYNKNFLSLYWDHESTRFALGYTSRKQTDVFEHAPLQTSKLTTDSIEIIDALDVQNTSSASFVTEGGASIQKSLAVGTKLGVGVAGADVREPLHVRAKNSNVLLESDNTQDAYLHFRNVAGNKHSGMLFDGANHMLSFTMDTNDQTPDASFRAMSINNAGYIGINTTDNISSPLTLSSNNFISMDSTDGYLGIMADASNMQSRDASKIILYGNDHNTNAGKIQVAATERVCFLTANATRLIIEDTGSVTIYSTNVATVSGNHALIVSGSARFACTENSNGTEGGSVTVEGGASILKDLHVGGKVTIEGDLDLQQAISAPNVVVSAVSNCIVGSVENTSLIVLSNEIILSCVVSVVPTEASANTEFEIVLPGRMANIVKRSDVVGTCSGWQDDEYLYVLQNILATGIPDSKKALVKFQSASTTASHTIQITLRYKK